MKKCYKRCIIIGATLLLIAIFVVPIWYIWTHYCCRLNSQAELMYFTFAVITGNATLLAVIVALFGKDIDCFLFPNECNTDIVGGNFAPVTQRDSPTPVKYEAKVYVENIGRRIIKDCELQVIKVGYKQIADAAYSMHVQNPKNVTWIDTMVKEDLRKKERSELVIAEILPPSGMPQANNNDNRPSLQINGAEIPLQEQTQGYWEIEYILKNSDDIIKAFIVDIHWTGIWNDVANEMHAGININLR